MSAGFGWYVKAIEVDLEDPRLRSRFNWGGAEERSLPLGSRGSAFDGLHGEEIIIGGDDDDSDAAIVGGEKRVLCKRLAGRQVGEWSEGGKSVADAEEEVAVAEAPKVLAVVVGAPGSAGQNVPGG